MSSGLYNTHKIDFDTTLDLTKLKPYGDTMNDGKVQTSFTLPVKDDERGEEAARQIAKKMGLEEPNVAWHMPLDKEFTFYVVYGSCVHTVNYEDIHVITCLLYTSAACSSVRFATSAKTSRTAT